MMAAISVILTATIVAASPDLAVSAKLNAAKLHPGREYSVTVSLDLAGGIDADKAGIPAPLLQIQTPGSIQLSGKRLTDYKDLARNEFLQEPYEQLLDKSAKTIRFKMLSEPDAADAINLNVVAYVADPATDHMRFVRKRLSLPLQPNAVAKEVDPTSSNWGIENLLQIGSDAPDFTLPTLTGETATLSRYRGKKNVIVTLYRAHW